MKPERRRDTDTEFMRIIAAFFVILLHISSLEFVPGAICNAVARFSVPTFVMISGYYILSEEQSLPKIAKRIARLMVLMVLWSGIYYCYDLAHHRLEWAGLKELLHYLLLEPVHLWYLYAMAALYLFTPALYVFCEHADRKQWRYALGLSLFLGAVVAIGLRSELSPTLVQIVEKSKAPYMLGFIFLYLFGGYVRRFGVEKEVNAVGVCVLGVAGLSVTVASVWLLPMIGVSQSLLLSFFAPNVIAVAVAFFLLSKRAFYRRPIRSARAEKAICAVGECTTGIYLIHPLILRIIDWHNVLPLPTDSVPLLLLRALIAYLLSGAVVFAIKRIPVLKRLF